MPKDKKKSSVGTKLTKGVLNRLGLRDSSKKALNKPGITFKKTAEIKKFHPNFIPNTQGGIDNIQSNAKPSKGILKKPPIEAVFENSKKPEFQQDVQNIKNAFKNNKNLAISKLLLVKINVLQSLHFLDKLK